MGKSLGASHLKRKHENGIYRPWMSNECGFVVTMVSVICNINKMDDKQIFEEIWAKLSARLSTVQPDQCRLWTGGISGQGSIQFVVMHG